MSEAGVAAQLAAMQSQQTSIQKDVASIKADLVKILDDHEERLRALERTNYGAMALKGVGVIALAAIAGAAAKAWMP